MKKKYKIMAVSAILIGTLIFFGVWTGVLPALFANLLGGTVGYHSGVVVFYNEARADDDTTDIDGAGSLEVIDAQSLQKTEATLTLGTDTETAKEYGSNQALWFVWKSTTANAMDHFSNLVILPMGDYAAGPAVAGSKGLPSWEVQWSSADGYWILTCYGAQEAQPTLIGYTSAGVDWSAAGADTYTFSATINYHYGVLKIAIAADYDGIFCFFDPEEGADGEWDRCILIATQNTTVANQGLFIQGGGWTPCKDANDYYYDLTPHLGTAGMLIRWDEEGQFGVIEIPVTFYCNGDLDTSGAGDTIMTFNFKECTNLDDAYNQNWDSDTLTNLSGAVTAEQVEFADIAP